MDKDGIKPESLKKILSAWSPEDAKSPDSDVPNFLYCVPHCSNPTGSTLTLERKQAIYEVHMYIAFMKDKRGTCTCSYQLSIYRGTNNKIFNTCKTHDTSKIFYWSV